VPYYGVRAPGQEHRDAPLSERSRHLVDGSRTSRPRLHRADHFHALKVRAAGLGGRGQASIDDGSILSSGNISPGLTFGVAEIGVPPKPPPLRSRKFRYQWVRVVNNGQQERQILPLSIGVVVHRDRADLHKDRTEDRWGRNGASGRSGSDLQRRCSTERLRATGNPHSSRGSQRPHASTLSQPVWGEHVYTHGFPHKPMSYSLCGDVIEFVASIFQGSAQLLRPIRHRSHVDEHVCVFAGPDGLASSRPAMERDHLGTDERPLDRRVFGQPNQLEPHPMIVVAEVGDLDHCRRRLSRFLAARATRGSS